MSLSDSLRHRPADRAFMRSLTTFAADEAGQRVGRLIPRPDIPIQPVLSWASFFGSGSESAPAVTDQGRVAFVTAARIAIAHALELAGIEPGQKVLVPAYHCIVMIEPIVHLGAQPVFYRLHEDLSVDLDDVAAKIDADTRAFIAVNYFGFPQDLRALRGFCDKRQLVFIEDCAHSFFGSAAGQPLGSFGHFTVASLTKFFPVRDGGCLVVNAGTGTDRALTLRSQGLGANIAASLDTVEEAIGFHRLTGLGPIVSMADRAKKLLRSAAPAAKMSHGSNPALERSGQLGGFDPDWVGVGATSLSRAICRYSSRRRMVERRRRNYARLADYFSTLKRCRPIFSDLPAGVVPFMFPLWIDNLAEIFPRLEDRAVPMQRFGQFLWPEMDKNLCAVTRRHSENGVQLACHHELEDDELTAIAERVRDALS